MLGFYTELTEYLERRYPDASELADSLTKAVPNADLEVLIENVEKGIAAAEASDLLPSANSEAMKDDLERFTTLRSYIRAFIVDRCERFEASHAVTELLPLLSLSNQMKVTIFTTNYDRIIEHCALEAGLNCSDGFVGEAEPVARWDRKFDGNLCLVKLHGSVNWFDDGSSIVRLDRGFPLPSHEFQLTWGGKELKALMVVPTLQKETLTPPYSDLRVLFGDVILTCSLLVVAGSSLRDAHITSVIANRLQDEKAVVLIIDPNIPAGVDALVRRDLVVHIPCEFHTFLAVAGNDFVALAHELASTSDIEEAIRRLRSFAETIQERVRGLDALTEQDKRAVSALSHGSPAEKVMALHELQGNSNEAVVDAVLVALARGAPEVQAMAASVASQADDPRAVPLLESIVTNSQDTRQKIEAALALKRMTVPEAALAVARIRQSQAITDPVVKRILS